MRNVSIIRDDGFELYGKGGGGGIEIGGQIKKDIGRHIQATANVFASMRGNRIDPGIQVALRGIF